MTTLNPPNRLDRESLLAGVGHLVSRDAALAEVVERHGPPPLWARRPGFATLIQIILEQQVSLASGKAIFKRIADTVGAVTADSIYSCGQAGLRDLGVTRQKATYCVAVAEAAASRTLDFRRVSGSSDTDAREELTRVKGVGPWTADVYLLMALRRPDVWPVGDRALVVSLGRALGRVDPNEEGFGWGPEAPVHLGSNQ